MMDGRALIKAFDYSAECINKQVRGICQQESLQQPIVDGHSINWLLGHIISSRSVPLRLVGATAIWSENSRSRYRNGSKSIGTSEANVIQIEKLHNLFNLSQRSLIGGLQDMSSAMLSQPSGYMHNTTFDSLLYFHFHETYHLGQMTMVAEHLGKSAAYIAL